jgi:hypothetical protein
MNQFITNHSVWSSLIICIIAFNIFVKDEDIVLIIKKLK